MDIWRELDPGERITAEIDQRAKSGNCLIKFGDREVNVGQVTENAVGRNIIIEKCSWSFGVCLNTEFRSDDYLETHPIAANDFYRNVGSDAEPEYRAWIRKNGHPQSGDLFVAEIDRIGRNGVGIIDTTSGHDIVVENVTEDDVGRLIEAELIETRLAKKVSDDPEIVSRLPSVSDIEDIETAERSEQSEDTDTKVSEKFSGSETASSESQTVSAEASDSQSVESESGTETQTVDELRKEAEEDAVEQVPQETTTNTSQTVQYTRSTKIKEYVKARADGVCEGCGEPAPFTSKTGDPYLHAHHVQELGDGGSDTPETVIALCPNCHYRVHHGKDGEDYNRELIERLADIENVSVESIRSQGI